MKTSKLVVPFALVFGLVGIACSPSGNESSSNPLAASSSQTAARVGKRTISVAEIDGQIGTELARIEMDLYRARKAKLDQMINEELVTQRAAQKGVTAEELAQQEVASQVAAPEESAVQEFYERLKAQGQKATFEELAPRIRQALSQQKMQEKQNEFLASLRQEAKVEISLEPPRLEVDTTHAISAGPKDAPITLVEFSDYQCPFCARSQDTVGKVLAKYEGKIQHLFMDFPLTSIHPMAMPAAVAGRCAGDQGKFWEFHKVLYDKQRELSPDNFKAWAAELSLDGEKFAACLASGKHDEAIQDSLVAGQKVGVSGTPGFFVNGIMINGAQPFDVFEETIDGELARLGTS